MKRAELRQPAHREQQLADRPRRRTTVERQAGAVDEDRPGAQTPREDGDDAQSAACSALAALGARDRLEQQLGCRLLEPLSVVRTSRATVGDWIRASGRASVGALPSRGEESMRTPCASSASWKRAAANAAGLSEITSCSASAESDAPISRETPYREDLVPR